MGLLLHLPFTGDLINHGIGDYNITSVGSYSWVNGKIGQALNLGNATTSTNAIQVNSNMCDDLGEEYTAAVWLYPLGEHPSYNGCVISSGNWNTANKRWSFGVSKDNSQVDAFGFNYNTYVTCSVPVNTWTHIVSVQKNNTAYVYKNGELVATRAMTQAALDSDKTFTNIGMCSYGNYFGFNGYINDLRIYNHALSPLEIKKLSQGLILHYPLNNNGLGGNNLAWNAINLDIASAKTNQCCSNRGASTRVVRSDGLTEINCTANWQGLSVWANQLDLNIGDKITYSFYIYTNGSTRSFSFYPMMYDSAGTRDTTSGLPISIDGGPYTTVNAKAFTATNTTTPERHFVTFEWNSAMQNIIDNGGSIELSIQVYGTWNSGDWACLYAPKLERGNKPTPFIDNVVFEKSGVIASNWGSAEGSRQEFRYLDTGVSLPISSGEKLMVSFDLKMIVNTAPSSGSAPYLIMYNSNYRGPHGNWTYYVNFNTELAGTYAVGDIIEKRINKIITVGALNPGTTRTTDVVEFYSNYGSNNWYEIKNFKIERYSDIEYDVSGYGKNGTLSKNIQTISNSPRYLTSTYFDGASEISSSTVRTGIVGNCDLTLSAWVYCDKTTWNSDFIGIIWNGRASQDLAFALCVYNGRPDFDIWNRRYIATNAISTKQWHHIAATKTAGTLENTKLYVDGVEVAGAVNTTNVTPNFTENGIVIGRLNATATRYHTGMISDVRIYATALSAEDILALYEDSAYIASDGTSYAYEFVEE